MNFKYLLTTLVLIILIVTGFYFFLDRKTSTGLVKAVPNFISKSRISSPTPIPTPAINEKSNLEAETLNLIPEDYSNDFKSLKESLN